MATTPVKVEKPMTPTMLWENPFGFPLFRSLNRELDALFNKFGVDRPIVETVPTAWNPAVEMFAKNNELFIKVDVPGMKKEEITLEVTEDHLVVSGERKEEKEEKKAGFYRSERTYGSFYRTIPLPEGVKPELAKAVLHDGVLEVTMPTSKVEAKTRKLEIAEPAPTPVNVKAA